MIKLSRLRQGSYGIVYSAEDENKNLYAVKRNLINKNIEFNGSLRELDLLFKLKEHPYIVKLINVSNGSPFFRPLSPACYKDDQIFFIFEKATEDFHDLIHIKDLSSSPEQIIYYTMQILLALEYIHQHRIIHRDLKPSNLLFFKDVNCVKICDFGFSKVETRQRPSTPNVATSIYRAPEIMCGWNDYSNKVDIWSLGCILVEAITKQHFIHAKDVDKALFRDLMRKHPDPLEPETRAKLDRENRYQSMKQAPKRKEWDQLLSPIKTTYPDFIDLIKQMLCWDPDKRISASEALEHPLFQNYRETIKQIREQYPPKNEVPLIRVEPDMRRKHIMEKACFIFKNRKIYDWYNHRIMFQSLDLFDRYLYQTKENPCKDEFQLNLIFSLCIYIAIKYFVPLERIPSFTSLIPEELRKEEYIKQAQDLEKYLIEEIFKYDIYHDTVLEMADLYGDILNEEETEKLFNIYSSLTSYDGMKADRIYLVVRNALGK